MKSWKKRALALTMAALIVLSGCTFPFGQGNDGDGAPVDNVDVSDAYFGLAWYRSGTTLNPVMDGTEVNSMLREALYEGLFEIKNERYLAAPVGRVFAHLAHDEAGNPALAGLVVVKVDAVVADERVRHGNDLTVVGRVGQNLLIACHAGVEYDLTDALSFVADCGTLEQSAVRQQ